MFPPNTTSRWSGSWIPVLIESNEAIAKDPSGQAQNLGIDSYNKELYGKILIKCGKQSSLQEATLACYRLLSSTHRPLISWKKERPRL